MLIRCENYIPDGCGGIKAARDDLRNGHANRLIGMPKQLGPLPYA